MKNLISVLILCSIVAGSFFAQTNNANIWENSVKVQESRHHQGNQNHHNDLIYSEFSNESEDSEQKLSTEIQFPDYQNIISEHKYIKNILNNFISSNSSEKKPKKSLSIFIKFRSILI